MSECLRFGAIGAEGGVEEVEDMRQTNRGGAARGLALAAAMLLIVGARLRAQELPEFRLWAAQTAPDQVTLAWSEVPGAVEYRVHVGDPDAPGSPAARQPFSVWSGSGRGGVLPLRGVMAGIFLVAMGSDGRRLVKVPFNRVTPVRGVRRVEAPGSATATVTGPEEVTLSWDAVPGATAYMILRAVEPGGYQMLCPLCSSEPTYVDRDVTPGVAHTYAVSAFYSGGVTERAQSNTVTPGDDAAADAGEPSGRAANPPLPSVPAGQPAPTTPTYTPPGQPAATTSTYTPPGQPARATPSYTPPGQPAGTMPTYTPPGQPASGGTTTPPAKTPLPYTPPGKEPPPTTLPTGAPPTTTTPAPDTLAPAAQLAAWVQQAAQGLASQFGTKLAAMPPGGPGSDTSGLAQIFAQAQQYARGIAQQFGPKSLSPNMMRPDTIYLVAQIMTTAREIASMFGSPFAGQTQPTHAATPAYAGSCRLDYQRADNMWAAAGRPDGQLGVETITLADGQAKAFVTDWKYEKQRNNGTTYYGSHLRLATNPGQRPVKLQVRSFFTAVRDLVGAVLAANGNYYLSLAPGKSQQFQADLVEVSCTN